MRKQLLLKFLICSLCLFFFVFSFKLKTETLNTPDDETSTWRLYTFPVDRMHETRFEAHFDLVSLWTWVMLFKLFRETFKLIETKSKLNVSMSGRGVDEKERSPRYTGLWSGEACVAVTVTHSMAVSLVLRSPVYSLSSR